MVDKLTDANVQEIKAVFQLFDSEVNDGNITKPEMLRFMNQIGVSPSKAEMDEFFNMFDSNGNGMIDFPEFLSLITKQLESDPTEAEEELQDAFNLFDENQDGLITSKELYQILARLGVERITEKDVEKMVDELAPHNNGYISFDDFKKIVVEYV